MLENKEITSKSLWEKDEENKSEEVEGEEEVITYRLSNPITPLNDFDSDKELGIHFQFYYFIYRHTIL